MFHVYSTSCANILQISAFTEVCITIYYDDKLNYIKMQRSESERDFQTLMRQKWALVILSVLAFLTSVAMFSICIWIRFDLDFWEWVVEIDW